MSKRAMNTGMAIALAALLAVTLVGLLAGQSKSETVRVGNTDLGGVVTSPNGPEAGVWVIAETTDLPTKFVRIVVTDERGRYLAGRACEVMLKLPLDLATRNRVNDVSRGPLEDIARFRMGAERAQRMHRPRQVEWTLLVILMALAGAGLIVAWVALGR